MLLGCTAPDDFGMMIAPDDFGMLMASDDFGMLMAPDDFGMLMALGIGPAPVTWTSGDPHHVFSYHRTCLSESCMGLRNHILANI